MGLLISLMIMAIFLMAIFCLVASIAILKLKDRIEYIENFLMIP